MSDTTSETDVLGPIDFLVVEFPGNEFNGEILPAMVELIAAGTVRLLDLAFVTKDEAGDTAVVELEELPDLGALGGIAGFLTDLLTPEELQATADELEPNSSAAVLIWENTWTVPFVRAVSGSGGQVVASGRLVASQVLDALADA